MLSFLNVYCTIQCLARIRYARTRYDFPFTLRFLRNFEKLSIKNTKLGNFPTRYDFFRVYHNVYAPGTVFKAILIKAYLFTNLYILAPMFAQLVPSCLGDSWTPNCHVTEYSILGEVQKKSNWCLPRFLLVGLALGSRKCRNLMGTMVVSPKENNLV